MPNYIIRHRSRLLVPLLQNFSKFSYPNILGNGITLGSNTSSNINLGRSTVYGQAEGLLELATQQFG